MWPDRRESGLLRCEVLVSWPNESLGPVILIEFVFRNLKSAAFIGESGFGLCSLQCKMSISFGAVHSNQLFVIVRVRVPKQINHFVLHKLWTSE